MVLMLSALSLGLGRSLSLFLSLFFSLFLSLSFSHSPSFLLTSQDSAWRLCALFSLLKTASSIEGRNFLEMDSLIYLFSQWKMVLRLNKEDLLPSLRFRLCWYQWAIWWCPHYLLLSLQKVSLLSLLSMLLLFFFLFRILFSSSVTCRQAS